MRKAEYLGGIAGEATRDEDHVAFISGTVTFALVIGIFVWILDRDVYIYVVRVGTGRRSTVTANGDLAWFTGCAVLPSLKTYKVNAISLALVTRATNVLDTEETFLRAEGTRSARISKGPLRAFRLPKRRKCLLLILDCASEPDQSQDNQTESYETHMMYLQQDLNYR